MSKFFVVSFNHQSVLIPPNTIEAELAKLKDWARFSPTTWIVWSDLKAKEIYELLEPLRTAKQYMFVGEMGSSPNWYSYMSQKIIDWMKQERPEDMPGL
jgi:hypothetical protein